SVSSAPAPPPHAFRVRAAATAHARTRALLGAPIAVLPRQPEAASRVAASATVTPYRRSGPLIRCDKAPVAGVSRPGVGAGPSANVARRHRRGHGPLRSSPAGPGPRTRGAGASGLLPLSPSSPRALGQGLCAETPSASPRGSPGRGEPW